MLQALKELEAQHQAAAQHPEQDPAAFAKLTAVLHGALQQRLQDEDSSVLHAVLQLPSLLGLPGAVLLQALRRLLQRCLTVLSKQRGEVEEQYRAETCSVAKQVGAFRGCLRTAACHKGGAAICCLLSGAGGLSAQTSAVQAQSIQADHPQLLCKLPAAASQHDVCHSSPAALLSSGSAAAVNRLQPCPSQPKGSGCCGVAGPLPCAGALCCHQPCCSGCRQAARSPGATRRSAGCCAGFASANRALQTLQQLAP